MSYVNEYDIATIRQEAERHNMPVALEGAIILDKLREWTDQNSDGWAYWVKPRNASKRLTEALEARFLGRYSDRITEDMTKEELREAMRPISAFFTRHKVAVRSTGRGLSQFDIQPL
jgi:hypothetical protein